MKIQCTQEEWTRLESFFIFSVGSIKTTIYENREGGCAFVSIPNFDDFLTIGVTFEE
jgi:hypothetical protein